MLLSFFYPGWLAGWLAGWLQCGWNQIKRSFENNNRRQEKKQQENIDTKEGAMTNIILDLITHVAAQLDMRRYR